MLKFIKRFLVGVPLGERPDVPCGDKKEHYEWVDARMACPNCMFNRFAAEKVEEAVKEKERKEREMEQLAEMIATKVVERMRVPAAPIVE